MHLFTSVKPKCTFETLNNINGERFEKCLELVTQWFTDEWGYIHDKDLTYDQAIAERKEYLSENTDRIHMVFYGRLIVGAFRIEDKEFEEVFSKKELLKTSDIWFIYVDPAYRSLGAGRQMLQEIKRLSKEDMKANMVLLETLKPGLNHFYMSENACVIGENFIESHPTDVLKIGL